MTEDSKIVSVASDAMNELASATHKFGKFASAHEGLAVIEEEFIELRVEVFTNPRKRYGATLTEQTATHKAAMRAEAIQLAAMAMRFVMDVCDAA